MKSSGFAIVLIVGCVMYVTGVGGWIAIGAIAIGGVGLVISAFGGKN